MSTPIEHTYEAVAAAAKAHPFGSTIAPAVWDGAARWWVDQTVSALLSDEEAMVEAVREARCYQTDWAVSCRDGIYSHPECAVAALKAHLLGES